MNDNTQKPPNDEPIAAQSSPQTNETKRPSAKKIAAFFLFGSLFILAGAAVLFFFGLMAYEKASAIPGVVVQNGVLVTNPDDTPEWEHSRLVTGLVSVTVATVGFMVLSFFVARASVKSAKGRFPSTWYLVITGVIPGFLFLIGWGLIFSGLPAKYVAVTKDDAAA